MIEMNTLLIAIAVLLMFIGYGLWQIERTQVEIMATLADLQVAIDAAPANITDAVVTAVKPLIQPAPDTQPQIDAVNALPQTVAQAVTAALTPPAP